MTKHHLEPSMLLLCATQTFLHLFQLLLVLVLMHSIGTSSNSHSSSSNCGSSMGLGMLGVFDSLISLPLQMDKQ